ncbi:hypothetical protein H5123_15770 [Shewanella sp. SR43-4]|jgi:hypothetical protein|uniref:Curlin associated repeat-containing protein n=1 Tax=Shewanella vesiculosa TaxID=518738 RepID=A0ABV0FNK4_9GAMM|nr:MULTISPECIES: hypothetical protein [Shewanella]NCQ44390.1 hypothetical protein [Shewanella frigidimarina]MBB1319091.1 hypothetical protein [Shewanella sp. SR43-4]MBB1389800.1 hypothetical protein [Shewanella sp. SG44-6]MBB1475730.1 hypothetical protein [Shewanella sp. SG41-3]NCO71652.1 hypothetical protein [Shewanella vesiculosa]|tara:strand:+ start:1740 stop:2453 length:714 start_codon:yes stop_codon:yes gene_type:complete
MKLSMMLLLAIAAPVMASSPSLTVFQHSQVLTDFELESMKGKYTNNGQDYYFGLQMQTQFIQDNGVQQQVGMQIEFTQVNNQPSVNITISDPNAISSNNGFQLDALGQTAGLQQRIQIAGSENLAINELDMAQGRLTPLVQGINVTVGTTLVSNNGNTTFSANGNTVGYQVELASGRASQGISYQNGNGQLVQSIFIDGLSHGVINQSTLRYEGMPVGPIESNILGRQISDLTTLGF